MEDHAENCVERYCEIAKMVESLQQVVTPCIDDHLIPPEAYENNRRALCEMCSDCPEVLALGNNWTTSKALKSSCALENHLTLEQSSNCELNCTQDKDLLARMVFLQKAEGNLVSDLEKTQGCVRQVVPYSVLCMGK